MRFFIELSYDGTEYAGWQRQPGIRTVQGCLEDTLSTIVGKPLIVTGCGRTDRGVHAKYFVAHVDFELGLSQLSSIIYKLNRMLPTDIACHNICEVPSSLHARFNAISRTYIYHIHLKKDPFVKQFSSFLPFKDKLKFDLLDRVSDIIKETTDFASFCKAHTDNKTMNCTIHSSEWKINKDKSSMVYQISSDRFLRGMVRLIVGSSINVALEKLALEDLKAHIIAGTRNHYMSSAPAKGLFLMDIKYPNFKRS